MKISNHLIANTALAIPVGHIFGLDNFGLAIFIFWGGIFIDIDHVAYFLLKYRGYPAKKIISIARIFRKRMEPHLYLFHSPEFSLILIISSFYYQTMLIVLLSSFVHLFLDIFEHYERHRSFGWMKHWSILYSMHYHHKNDIPYLAYRRPTMQKQPSKEPL